MKNNFRMLAFMVSVACAVFACSSSLVTGVPQGSVMTGVYKGSFNGTGNEGSIEVKLYRSPDGSQPCFGNFGEEGSYLNFKGEIRDNELQGEILLPLEGTITGTLSSDGGSFNGTYKFTIPPFDRGTWNASKQ